MLRLRAIVQLGRGVPLRVTSSDAGRRSGLEDCRLSLSVLARRQVARRQLSSTRYDSSLESKCSSMIHFILCYHGHGYCKTYLIV